MRQKIIYILLALLIIAGIYDRRDQFFPIGDEKNESTQVQLEYAYKNRISNVQVEGTGIVVKTLRDDTTGSRHQRFILRVNSNQTVLVAHNIDLAPRVDSLRNGDEITFYGEYEWNEKGGVIHWTHHDPAKKHIDGWLKHNGRTYQ